MGPFVAELKRFIERLKLAESDVRELGRDIIRLKQGMRDLWTEGGGGLPGADFTGQVDGCSSHGFPGAQVEIKDPGTGAVIQTLTANGSGAFSGTLALSAGTSQDVDFEATPTGTHAAKFAGPVTESVTLSEGPNTVPTITLLPASGFVCGPTNYYPDATVAWTFNVNGCKGTGIAGALIELKQGGVLIASCTTANGTGGTTLGRCILNVPAGTYDIIITGPSGAGFAVNTSSSSISGTKTTTTTLAGDSSHVCIAICDYPIPKTLFTTDGLGTHTLTWNGSSWVGTATTSTGVRQVVDSLTKACITPGTMTVTYSVDQSLVLTVGWHVSCCYIPGGPLGQPLRIDYVYGDDVTFGGTSSTKPIGATGPATIGSCSPVSATTNVATVGTVQATPIDFCGTSLGVDTYAGFDNPGGGGMMAVTE